VDEVARFREVVEVARSQGGFFTNRQLEVLGLSWQLLEEANLAEIWCDKTYKLLAYSQPQKPALTRIRFLLIDKFGWPATVFSHRTALHLHGLDEESDLIHCRKTLAIKWRAVPSGVILHSGQVADFEVTTANGFPVTNLVTTLLDLLNDNHDWRLLVNQAVGQAVADGTLTEEQVLTSPARHRAFLLRAGGYSQQFANVTKSHNVPRAESLAAKLHKQRLTKQREFT
jgi:hypothetical protein